MSNETLAAGAEDIGYKLRPRYGLGLFGLIFAVFGLALAISRPFIADLLDPPPPPQPPQELSETIAKAGEKFVNRMLDKVRRKAATPAPAPPPRWPLLLCLSIAATSLGLIGALAGTAGLIRHEMPRPAVSAIAIGALAAAWVYIVVALVIALVICFLLIMLRAGFFV